MSKQKNWKVRSHSEPIADTGDYDGYWEIVNDKGDSFRTSEDYDDIEKDLQKIADLLNSFDGALSLETACEINLHCDNMQLKMELDHVKKFGYNQLCPKCDGQKTVSTPPGTPADVRPCSSWEASYPCDICKGEGVIPRPEIKNMQP